MLLTKYILKLYKAIQIKLQYNLVYKLVDYICLFKVATVILHTHFAALSLTSMIEGGESQQSTQA